MCFSAPASFIAGSALTVVGGKTIKKNTTKQAWLFASIPLIFGIQQIIEGLVWLTFGQGFLHTVATYGFIIFSHILWPILVPLSVLFMEQDKLRRKILLGITISGLIVGCYYLWYFFIAQIPVTAQIINNSIVYVYSNLFPFITSLTIWFYLIATCGSCLFSSYKMVTLFGTVQLISALIAYHFYQTAFVSVWCFFAAILSIIVYMHFEYENKKEYQDCPYS